MYNSTLSIAPSCDRLVPKALFVFVVLCFFCVAQASAATAMPLELGMQGRIIGAVVSVHPVREEQGEFVFDARPYGPSITTALQGRTWLKLSAADAQGRFLIVLSARPGARMLCEVVSGCVMHDGRLISFGEALPLPASFFLYGLLEGGVDDTVASAQASPLTHMAVHLAMSLKGGLSVSNLALAKRRIATMFRLSPTALDLPVINIAGLRDQEGVSKEQLRAALIGGALLAMANRPEWTDMSGVLNYLAERMVEAGTLLATGSAPGPAITLRDVFAEASRLANDLSELSRYPTLHNALQAARDDFSRLVLELDTATGVRQPRIAASVQRLKQDSPLLESRALTRDVPPSASVVSDLSPVLPVHRLYSLRSAANAAQARLQGMLGSNSAPPADAPMTVVMQPVSQSIAIGGRAEFSVGVTGGSGMQYQWFRNGLVLPGANANPLVISPITQQDAGAYHAQISNAAGALIYSNVADLVVSPTAVGEADRVSAQTIVAAPIDAAPVWIALHPENQSVHEGRKVRFTVGALGSAKTYQWFKNDIPIMGATAYALELETVSLHDAGSYHVRVSNALNSELSKRAVLTVQKSIQAAPVITLPVRPGESAPVPSPLPADTPVSIAMQPVSLVVSEGSVAKFSVGALGTAKTYQWFKDSTPIPGATAYVFELQTVSLHDAGRYHVRVSNALNSELSESVLLTVQKVVQSVPSAPAPTPVPNQPVASAPVVTSPEPVQGLEPVWIVLHPESQAHTEGARVRFTVGALGTAKVYQWYKNDLPISGATAYALELEGVSLSDAGVYKVQVRNAINSAFSKEAMLSVKAKPVAVVVSPVSLFITQQPLSQALVEGAQARFSVNTNLLDGLTYQWFKDSTPIMGATGVELMIPVAGTADAGLYRVRVSRGVDTIYSDSAYLAVSQKIGEPLKGREIELSWSVPDQREDGSYLSLNEISGYVIVWGSASGDLRQQRQVSGASVRSTLISGLTVGPHYFRIATVDSRGVQGRFSPEISVQIAP